MKTKSKKRNKKPSKPLKIKKQTKEQSELITIILLCDSPGYRMKSYGPISLINIGDLKLIDIQISAIKQVFSNFELIICLGFDSDKVSQYIRSKYNNINIRFIENQLYNSSNSCESLRLSLNNTFNNKVLICDGNLLLNNKCLSHIDTKSSCALIEKNPCDTLEIGLNIDENNKVQHFCFGATKIWSEIIFLYGEEVIESLRRIIVAYESKTRFMFEAINGLINMKYAINCITNNSNILKINNIKTYHNIKDSKVKIYENTYK
jgi:hypothetical protein